MKTDFKEKSIQLRRKGHSVKYIAVMLSVAQSSVSTWVRDVRLTPAQKLYLRKKCHSPVVIEKRRKSRLANEARKKTLQINAAADSIKKIDFKSLKMIGLGLYWGEGSKTLKGAVRVSNSDPTVIMMCMRFFKEICHIPPEKFRAHIHIHSVAAAGEAEKYWSNVTGVPLSQFYKTYTIKSKSSKNVRTTLPYGTLDIGINDIQILLKILGWIEGLKRQAK